MSRGFTNAVGGGSIDIEYGNKYLCKKDENTSSSSTDPQIVGGSINYYDTFVTQVSRPPIQPVLSGFNWRYTAVGDTDGRNLYLRYEYNTNSTVSGSGNYSVQLVEIKGNTATILSTGDTGLIITDIVASGGRPDRGALVGYMISGGNNYYYIIPFDIKEDKVIFHYTNEMPLIKTLTSGGEGSKATVRASFIKNYNNEADSGEKEEAYIVVMSYYDGSYSYLKAILCTRTGTHFNKVGSETPILNTNSTEWVNRIDKLSFVNPGYVCFQIASITSGNTVPIYTSMCFIAMSNDTDFSTAIINIAADSPFVLDKANGIYYYYNNTNDVAFPNLKYSCINARNGMAVLRDGYIAGWQGDEIQVYNISQSENNHIEGFCLYSPYYKTNNQAIHFFPYMRCTGRNSEITALGLSMPTNEGNGSVILSTKTTANLSLYRVTQNIYSHPYRYTVYNTNGKVIPITDDFHTLIITDYGGFTTNNNVPTPSSLHGIASKPLTANEDGTDTVTWI